MTMSDTVWTKMTTFQTFGLNYQNGQITWTKITFNSFQKLTPITIHEPVVCFCKVDITIIYR
ncbi:hypothetical protein Hanom_Chr02g00169911 [Helianthus anomalus]